MEKTGIYFIYDGECPLCKGAAMALRIQKKFGHLYLINAREINKRDNKYHPLMKAITHRNLSLDDGMVIYENNGDQQRFYHGKDALKFMAKHGDSSTFFMLLCKSVFWSDLISSLTYPWMRATRNWLLRKRHIGKIDNLSNKATLPSENPSKKSES